MPYLVGGLIFPHGTITLDPDTRDLTQQPAYRQNTKEDCLKLHAAMRAQARILVQCKPDLILMTTPHGLRMQSTVVVHGNSKSYGSAEWNGDWTNFTAEIPIDQNSSQKLVKYLQQEGLNADLLSVGSPTTQKLPLNWGEAVPWWFISQAYSEASQSLPSSIVIGIASSVQATPGKIPELIKFGGTLWNFFKADEFRTKRIALVISCDLSHYHSTDPTSPYPFHPDAQLFDDLCDQWSQITIDKGQAQEGSESNEILLSKAGILTDHIGTCGYTGLVILQGVLTSCVADKDASVPPTFIAKKLQYSWPTYYGMLVAYFLERSVKLG